MQPILGHVPRSVLRRAALIAAAVLAAPSATFAQVDNFDDGDDDGWTRYDPFADPLVMFPRATYSFPEGNTYRIQSDTSPAPDQVGPSRAGSIRNDESFTGFYISVDLVNWDGNLDQAFGILARVNNVGLAQTDGYALTYATDGSIDISFIDNEQPDGRGDTGVVLNPLQDYRLVFSGAGEKLRGQVFLLENPGLPLALAEGTDATYASGNTGLVVFDNSGGTGTTDATFDNYVATIPGDANADGTVDVADLGILSTNFNGFFDSALNNTWSKGDFNLDNVVDVSDLGALATNFNQSVNGAGGAGLTFEQAMALPQFANLAAAVPEPGGMICLAAAAGAGLIRRRRGGR
jgi:hypothetical protein